MIKLYIANLGKYNESELVGEWIELPIDEDDFNDMLVRIKLGHYNEDGDFVQSYEEDGIIYEEYAIHDYETDIDGLEIGEYSSISDLNELAEKLDNYNDAEKLVFSAMLQESYDISQIEEKLDDGDYSIYRDCSDMEDVAREYAEETGLLDEIPENLQDYFDFEAYGRDMDDGNFIFIDNDCVELY